MAAHSGEDSLLTEADLIRNYREHATALYAFVSRRVGGDRVLAEDIVQDTWLRAVSAWRSRGAPDVPEAWLMKVARNLVVDYFRRRQPLLVDPTELDLEDDRLSPDRPWTAALVNWGLTRVGKRQAQLLEAFYFDGKSAREIAKELELSERAVEGRLRRARQNLKKRLAPYVTAESTGTVSAKTVRPPEPDLGLQEGGKKHA